MRLLLEMTSGAQAVAQTDPHGWTLTLISISVVFCSLVILYCIYAISGGIASGQFKDAIAARRRRRAERKGSTPDAETAAAIALALDDYLGSGDAETAAAIALALFLETQGGIHDVEPGFLTFRNEPGPWADKSLTFRKNPRP